MNKFTSIIWSILLLAGVLVGAALWLNMFFTSVQAYRSPVSDTDLSPEPSVSADNNNVVVVLISGLGYDAELNLALPVLSQLKQVGVYAAVESTPPTFSQTAWATLLSGASPETNDAPPVDVPPDKLHLLQVDTLFARAHTARLKTALLGLADWRRMIPRNQLDYTLFVNDAGPESDQAVLEEALALIERDEVDFMLVHFIQLNWAGQTQGGPGSAAYDQAARRIDGYLEQLAAALDLKQATLVIVSDHGQIGFGGHGGPEPEVIWQPLVMVGGGTVPGIYSDIHQTDIAPTLATLMGLAPPGAAQGNILFDMLRLAEDERAAAQITLAAQRVALAQTYVRKIQDETASLPDSASEDVSEDLAGARRAFDNQNPDGAFELALLAQKEADRQMAVARQSRLRSEQWPRLFLTVVILIIWLAMIWRRRRGLHAGSVLIAAVITIALYHALYQLQGHSYTLSSLNAIGYTQLPLDTARRVAVSLLAGGGLMLIFFMLTGEENWITLLGTGYGFCVLVTFVFVSLFLWGYWQNGWRVTWHLPAVEPVFWQISGALEAMSAAVLGLILPWPVMLLSVLVNFLRRHLSRTQPTEASEPGPGPGLRL